MITRPTFLVKEEVCRRNIRRMADKARKSGVIFRPHFKTHQSAQIGEWFRDEGVEKITVSSVEMAEEFVSAGWTDITIAFPANPLEISAYNILASKIKLKLIADSTEVISFLEMNLDHKIGLFIEIDCGYGRSGVPYDDNKQIDKIVEKLKGSEYIEFRGFLTHAGNTYHAKSKEEIIQIHDDSILKINTLKDKYAQAFPELLASVGDTPSCSIVEDLSGADEVRPGNFIYYDMMQLGLGVCHFEDIAVSVACPVTGIYPERNEILVHGGAIHLSKEHIEEGGKHFGLIVQYTESGWSKPLSGTKLISMSQEHGMIRASEELLKSIRHGDLLGIIPVHSCLTAKLLKSSTRII